MWVSIPYEAGSVLAELSAVVFDYLHIHIPASCTREWEAHHIAFANYPVTSIKKKKKDSSCYRGEIPHSQGEQELYFCKVSA